MNIKALTLGLVIGASSIAPSIASAHTVLGDTVHLDLSAGTLEERVVGTDSTNVTSGTAHLYSNISNNDTVYVNATESYVSHSGVLFHGYSALTGAIGLTHDFNSRVTGTVELGNRVNDQRYLAGSNATVPFIGLSVTHHTF